MFFNELAIVLDNYSDSSFGRFSNVANIAQNSFWKIIWQLFAPSRINLVTCCVLNSLVKFEILFIMA